jgi:hypothetical protein
MRRAWWAIVGCAACAAAVGCFTRAGRVPVGPTDPVVRSLAPVVPTEGAVVETVLLERPVGDRFLDRDLWADALPIGGQEARVLLSENGLRAGVLAGSLPPRFQAMLESDAEALSARRMTFSLRKDEVLPTSGPHPRCALGVLNDVAGRRVPLAFEEARCGVQVRPEPAGPGRVKVTCEPHIQHGERRSWLRPSADGTGFVKHEEVPLARFPALAFDALLGPNEYLLIGWDATQPDTLGAALFGVPHATGARQRVLVVRAQMANPGPAPDLPPLGGPRRAAIAAEAGRPSR